MSKLNLQITEKEMKDPGRPLGGIITQPQHITFLLILGLSEGKRIAEVPKLWQL